MILKKCRVYLITLKDAEVINKTLAKLQAVKKLKRIMQSIPFLFSVFIIWWMMPDGTQKGCMVIDM